MIEAHGWDERLDLANEPLDREHHLQVALVSALIDALEQGRPSLVRRLAGQLAGYSEAHFASEELLMEASAVPEREAHAAEHAALLARIRELSQATGGADGSALEQALDLRQAIAGHIAGADRRLAASAGWSARRPA